MDVDLATFVGISFSFLGDTVVDDAALILVDCFFVVPLTGGVVSK